MAQLLHRSRVNTTSFGNYFLGVSDNTAGVRRGLGGLGVGARHALKRGEDGRR